MFFPGDSDFTWENYSSLPYPYVINAFTNGSNLYRESMHDRERPIALATSLIANKGRDPKKSKTLSYLDMSFYKPIDQEGAVDYYYGSAMMQLAKRKLLPSWTLFCFKEVTANAASDYIPEMCALIAEDAILLHPVQHGHIWEGMLIAQESASEQRRVFKSETGVQVTLTVPHVHTKIVCEEDARLIG